MNGEMTMGRIPTRLCVLLAAAFMTGLGGQAFAADATTVPVPAAAETPQLEEVVVTGSRIPVPANISATSPTTIVTGQDVKLQGHTDITDVINSLPQNIVNSNADFGNTSNPLTATGGFSTVDLRWPGSAAHVGVGQRPTPGCRRPQYDESKRRTRHRPDSGAAT